MLVAGVDVGAVSAKAVVLQEGRIAGFAILPTGYDVAKSAVKVGELAVAQAHRQLADLRYVIGTGYARRVIPYANEAITEISCHARGAASVIAEARTIIDIGGQDSKVIRVDAKGNVLDFLMNDKCAAGTGRFLEVMARALELSLEEFSSVSQLGPNPCEITNTCTVFAESEIISLRAEQRSREDIIAGLYRSIASRVGGMVKRVGCEDVVVFTGGVANNKALLKIFEQELGCRIFVPEQPQIMGALGAALFAQKRALAALASG